MKTTAAAVVAAGLGLGGLGACAPAASSALVVPTDVEVTMNCRIVAGGGLEDCRVVRERPGGYGMGAEALASAEQGRASVQPVGSDRRVSGVGSRMTVSMRVAIDAAAMARARRGRPEVSEPRM